MPWTLKSILDNIQTDFWKKFGTSYRQPHYPQLDWIKWKLQQVILDNTSVEVTITILIFFLDKEEYFKVHIQ